MGIPAADLPPWGFFDRPKVYKTKRWDSTIWLSFDSEPLDADEERGLFPYRDVINRWVADPGPFSNTLFHSSIMGAQYVISIQLKGAGGVHLLVGKDFIEAVIRDCGLHGLNMDDYSENTVEIDQPVEVAPAWASSELDYGTPDELLEMQEIYMLFSEEVDPEDYTD